MLTKTVWLFDEDGYYCGPGVLYENTKRPGTFFERDDCLEVAPDFDLEANFAKVVNGAWVAEKKPTCAQECSEIGDLDHHKQTARVNELRKLFDELCAGSETHRVEQDPETLAKRVVEIPPEEGIAAEADQELAVFDAQVASLKDRMATAMLMGDDEAVAELRAEYQALMA